MDKVSYPRFLKDFNLYIDGHSYAGRCESVTLPQLASTVESYRGAGMLSSIDIVTGLEPMSLQMVVADFDPTLFTLISKPNCAVTLRGSVQAQGKNEEAVVVNARGLFKGIEVGQWQTGTKGSQTLTMSLSYFKYQQNQVEYVEIDVLNLVQRINGVDQMSTRRGILGL